MGQTTLPNAEIDLSAAQSGFYCRVWTRSGVTVCIVIGCMVCYSLYLPMLVRECLLRRNLLISLNL